MTSERDRIALLRAVFGAPNEGVGIGDDAAVLAGGLVWTVDAQVEGVHFRRAWLTWEDVGFRSTMAAASDLAAMGAEPIASLSSLVLAPDVDLEALAKGQAAAAAAIGAPVVGGNLSRGTETSITTTLLGRTDEPLLRSGARPGDLVLAAGAIGLARAGLLALEGGKDLPAIAAWRRPEALIAAGRAARGKATSAIDLSDGLASDARHLAEASGVVVELDARWLVSDELASAAQVLSRDPIALALEGGEDYALLVTSPGPIDGFRVVGRICAGPPNVLLAKGGAVTEVARGGFDHFR